jgi:hypothetical protein
MPRYEAVIYKPGWMGYHAGHVKEAGGRACNLAEPKLNAQSVNQTVLAPPADVDRRTIAKHESQPLLRVVQTSTSAAPCAVGSSFGQEVPEPKRRFCAGRK